MMKTYLPQNGGLKATSDAESASAIASGLWIDLIDPTPEERQNVNNALGMELPTRADMEEIEISSRLYSEDGGLFMPESWPHFSPADLRAMIEQEGKHGFLGSDGIPSCVTNDGGDEDEEADFGDLVAKAPRG